MKFFWILATITAFVVTWCAFGIANARAHDAARLNPGDVEFLQDLNEEERLEIWALAVVCISEADFNESPDCAAIAQRHHAVARRTRKPLIDVIRESSPLATDYCNDPRGTRLRRCRLAGTRARQIWVSTLRLDGGEPSGWAVMNAGRIARDLLELPWNNSRRERWLEIVQDASRFIRRSPRVCAHNPDTWGGACTPDLRPATRTGVCDAPPSSWIRIDCGPGTFNAFYLTPRVRRRVPTTGTIPALIARGDRN